MKHSIALVSSLSLLLSSACAIEEEADFAGDCEQCENKGDGEQGFEGDWWYPSFEVDKPTLGLLMFSAADPDPNAPEGTYYKSYFTGLPSQGWTHDLVKGYSRYATETLTLEGGASAEVQTVSLYNTRQDPNEMGAPDESLLMAKLAFRRDGEYMMVRSLLTDPTHEFRMERASLGAMGTITEMMVETGHEAHATEQTAGQLSAIALTDDIKDHRSYDGGTESTFEYRRIFRGCQFKFPEPGWHTGDCSMYTVRNGTSDEVWLSINEAGTEVYSSRLEVLAPLAAENQKVNLGLGQCCESSSGEQVPAHWIKTVTSFSFLVGGTEFSHSHDKTRPEPECDPGYELAVCR